MPTPEIYANPHRLRALADELRMFTNDLRAELSKISDGLRHLGATWQDDSFRRFKAVLDPLCETLSELDREIGIRETTLKEDADRLLDALRHQPS